MKFPLWVLVLFLIFPLSESHASGSNEMGSRVAVCNCVAFRLDDIQDYFLNQAQMQVIETFEDRNASLTIGVIANYTGYDQVLLSFLKEKLESENFSIDVANHGMNHEDFSLLEREVQSDLIAAANEQIMATLGVQPSVFITPFNRMNEDTPLAMAENNLNIVSAGLETVAPYVGNVTSSAGIQAIHHFPRTAETGDISSDGTSWVGSNHNKTMQDIRESIDKYGYAVVMMHPQEFSVREGINFENIVDSDQLAELELLLDAVMQEGYSIRTVSELARYRTVPEFSVFALIAAGIGVAVFWALGKSAKFRGHLPL